MTIKIFRAIQVHNLLSVRLSLQPFVAKFINDSLVYVNIVQQLHEGETEIMFTNAKAAGYVKWMPVIKLAKPLVNLQKQV